MEELMPKCVNTSSAEVLVLTEEEFFEIQEKLKGDTTDLGCPSCGARLEHIEVFHPVFTSSTSPDLDLDNPDQIATYEAWFCPPCEEVPLYAGYPVVMEGSFHNRSN
jgi:hypothetical protein